MGIQASSVYLVACSINSMVQHKTSYQLRQRGWYCFHFVGLCVCECPSSWQTVVLEAPTIESTSTEVFTVSACGHVLVRFFLKAVELLKQIYSDCIYTSSKHRATETFVCSSFCVPLLSPLTPERNIWIFSYHSFLCTVGFNTQLFH